VLFIVNSAIAKEPTEPKSKKNNTQLLGNYINVNDWESDLASFILGLFLPVHGKYNEGSHTNREIPQLTADRKNSDVNKLKDSIIIKIKQGVPTMRSLKPSHCWATTYLK
jgi:hypothetical protein